MTAKVVRILGTAPNLGDMPSLTNDELGHIEVWPSNDPRNYRKRHATVLLDWTRWFNLHSRSHMETTYPKGFQWYLDQDGSKPFYTQKYWSDIPGCLPFPRSQIQEAFATPTGPNKFFTCSVCWLIAFAILEGFDRIELWGFQLRDKHDGVSDCYKFERPCFFYWVQVARDRGVTVWYQPEVEAFPFIMGDPNTYTGPVYGYETKPEPSSFLGEIKTDE